MAENETHTGLIGLIKNDYDIISTKHLIQGRIMNLKIQHKTEKTNYNINTVYLDTNKNMNKEKIQNIVRTLQLEQEEHSNNMIIWDFNFIDNERDKAKGLSSTDKLVNKIWAPFLEETDMVDPFREQNPKRKVWSFIGSGAAGNSRIDRIYVNSINTKSTTNIRYIQTPFNGHRILTFTLNRQKDKGQGYYKMNTSILKDAKYRELVEESISQINRLGKDDDIEKWEVFLMTIKSKSIYYSERKNRIKKGLKREIMMQILKIEENGSQEKDHYNYLKQKLKEIEEKEIEGYIQRVKYNPPYEKCEPDIAFFSKLEGRKIASDRIEQLAENQNGKIYTDKENMLRIATMFYKDLYTPKKLSIKKQEKLLKT